MAICVVSEIKIAATYAAVVRREHLLLDLRHFRSALLLLEAEGDFDVAGELAAAVGVGVVHHQEFVFK